MITGAHTIIYSTNPEIDRDFLRNVLKFPNVDVGDGWLIFALPPSEIAVHPSEENDIHTIYLMCDDINAFVEDMKSHQIECSRIVNREWGILTSISLPGGGSLGVYEPLHDRPVYQSSLK